MIEGGVNINVCFFDMCALKRGEGGVMSYDQNLVVNEMVV
jgi:hypothetical protein